MYTITRVFVSHWLNYNIWGLFILVTFNGLAILSIYSHLMTMTTDPGAVPVDAAALEENDKLQLQAASGNIFEGTCAILEINRD